jgi:hypothetical protein
MNFSAKYAVRKSQKRILRIMVEFMLCNLMRLDLRKVSSMQIPTMQSSTINIKCLTQNEKVWMQKI